MARKSKRRGRSPRRRLKPSQGKQVIIGLALLVGSVACFNLGKIASKWHLYQNSQRASEATIAEINIIRGRYKRSPIQFDHRLFRLATDRAKDMLEHGYYDHTNPQTGSCAHSEKAQYGLNSEEFVAENILEYGSKEGIGNLLFRPMTDSLKPWMDSRGHRYNLLYSHHVAGAVSCLDNKCVFLGLNQAGFGKGCSTAAQGRQYWRKAPIQSDEVAY